MFSYQHFIWLFLSVAAVALLIFFYEKKRPPLKKVLTSALILSVVAEVFKVIVIMQLVPSTSGETMTPYLELGRMPLHLCYLQMFLIAYARFSKQQTLREYVLAFIYPTSIVGAFSALLLPNVFQQDISPAQAFTSPLPYWFFPYHAMLVALGIIIARSGEIAWKKKHFTATLILLAGMGFLTLYLNSLFSSPTYADGKLISVDYSTNFFYTYANPLGIPFTAIWQWRLYMLGYTVLATGLLYLFFLPLIAARERAEKKAALLKNASGEADAKPESDRP